MINNKNMNKLMSLFSGKKTYIVGILFIVLGLMQGDNSMVLQGLGFMTVRSGIAKMTR